MVTGRFTFKQGASNRRGSFSTRCVYVLPTSSRLAPPRADAMRRIAGGSCLLVRLCCALCYIACCCVVHVKIEKAPRASNAVGAAKYAMKL